MWANTLQQIYALQWMRDNSIYTNWHIWRFGHFHRYVQRAHYRIDVSEYSLTLN
jgi:hypothetical protein